MDDAVLKLARTKAARYCAQRERATTQVMEKLLSWDLSTTDATDIVAWLRKERFLDDARFCRAFCHDKFQFNRWGRLRIRLELQQLGVSENEIADGLQTIDEAEYERVARELATKKWMQTESTTDPWARKKKTCDYLLQKGFEYPLARQIAEQLSAGQQ